MFQTLIRNLTWRDADDSIVPATELERFIKSLINQSGGIRQLQRRFSGSSELITIMPMGDSITAGTEPGGYRTPLQTLLKWEGIQFDFVGSQISNDDPSRDPNHWGKSGWGIAKTDESLAGKTYVSLQSNESSAGSIRNGLLSDLDLAISSNYFSNTIFARNIVLLMVGTNDIIHQVVGSDLGASPAGDKNNDGLGEQQDKIAESTFERLRFFLAQMDQNAHDSDLEIDVIIGTIPKVTDQWSKDPISSVMQDEIIEYNGFITEELPKYTYDNLSVSIVDQFSAIGSSLSDGLHPNSEGYAAMAQAWLGGIEQVLIS